MTTSGFERARRCARDRAGAHPAQLLRAERRRHRRSSARVHGRRKRLRRRAWPARALRGRAPPALRPPPRRERSRPACRARSGRWRSRGSSLCGGSAGLADLAGSRAASGRVLHEQREERPGRDRGRRATVELHRGRQRAEHGVGGRALARCDLWPPRAPRGWRAASIAGVARRLSPARCAARRAWSSRARPSASGCSRRSRRRSACSSVMRSMRKPHVARDALESGTSASGLRWSDLRSRSWRISMSPTRSSPRASRLIQRRPDRDGRVLAHVGVDEQRAAGREHAVRFGQHLRERLRRQMFEHVERPGLGERAVGERQPPQIAEQQGTRRRASSAKNGLMSTPTASAPRSRFQSERPSAAAAEVDDRSPGAGQELAQHVVADLRAEQRRRHTLVPRVGVERLVEILGLLGEWSAGRRSR